MTVQKSAGQSTISAISYQFRIEKMMKTQSITSEPSISETTGHVLAGPDIDFVSLRNFAVDKGYETFIYDAMVERSVMMAVYALADVSIADQGRARSEVSQHFKSRLDRSGGFRKAYTEEQRAIRQLSPFGPSNSLDQLSNAIKGALLHEPRSDAQQAAMSVLLEQARTSASTFRSYGFNDGVVIEMMSLHKEIVENEIFSLAKEFIESDKSLSRRSRAPHMQKPALQPDDLKSQTKAQAQVQQMGEKSAISDQHASHGIAVLTGVTPLGQKTGDKRLGNYSPH